MLGCWCNPTYKINATLTPIFNDPHFYLGVFFIAGIFHVPSTMEGGVSFGQ